MSARRMAAAALTVTAGVMTGQMGVAHAASQSVSENCYSNANSYIAIGLEIGETLTIHTNALGDCDRVGTFTGAGVAPQGVGTATAGATGTEHVVPYNAGTTSISSGDRIIYTATAEGSIRLLLEDWVFNAPTYYDITVTAASSSGSTAAQSAPEAGAGDVLQQVGMPAEGCQSVLDPSLNWAHVSSGGWAQSWAPWANDGLGGGVCTRTLTHLPTGWRVLS